MRSCRKKPKRSANVRSGALQRRRTEAAGIMAKPLANLLLPGTPPKIARGLVGHATTDSKTVSWQSLLHQKLFTPATPLFIKYLQAIDNLRTPFSHTRCAILNTVRRLLPPSRRSASLLGGGESQPGSGFAGGCGFGSGGVSDLSLFGLGGKMASFRHLPHWPRSLGKKSGINRCSPASKALEESPAMTRFSPAIPTDGGMLKIPTKESKTSYYPAIGMGYTVISRGC